MLRRKEGKKEGRRRNEIDKTEVAGRIPESWKQRGEKRKISDYAAVSEGRGNGKKSATPKDVKGFFLFFLYKYIK